MKPLAFLAALALFAAAGCAHALGGLANLEIRDAASGRILPVYWHQGRAYVAGEPGSEYRLALRNRRGRDLLAVISVDGVNVLSGETASAGQGGYVLSGSRPWEIAGWRKSLAEVAAFYFTPLGDSYAARTGRPANVGVIGVALFERARPLQPAYDEVAPASRAKAQSSNEARAAPSAPLGTGHGRREDSPVRQVEFERATSVPAETITLYYDSYPNLVAQGVIAATRERRPEPFPGFVPDPA
jgi:hypothetical protein